MDSARFDAFARSIAHRPSRRRLFQVLAGLGLGGVLLRPVARPVAARTPTCPRVSCPTGFCIFCEITSDMSQCACGCKPCSSSGIAGGGLVRTETGGEAHVALLATRTADPSTPDVFGVHGQVRWVDPAWEGTGLLLESVAVHFYGPLADVEGGREAIGWVRADRAPGEFPFVLRAVDAGPPGGGQDTVSLWVGDAVLEDPAVAGTPAPALEPTGFRYVAEGSLVSGDLQLLSLASLQSTPPATPTP